MHNPPLSGDRVELRAAFAALPDDLEAVVPQRLFRGDSGTGMKPRPSTPITFMSARPSNSTIEFSGDTFADKIGYSPARP